MFNMIPMMFGNMIGGMMNDRGLIDNIVDSILSNNNFQTMISSIDNMQDLDLQIKEYDSLYLVEGKLPGINKKDIDIDYCGDHVIITIKRNQVFSNGVNTMMAISQPGNDFKRTFYVPGVDPLKLKAAYNSEILQVYLPKKYKLDTDSPVIEVQYKAKV